MTRGYPLLFLARHPFSGRKLLVYKGLSIRHDLPSAPSAEPVGPRTIDAQPPAHPVVDTLPLMSVPFSVSETTCHKPQQLGELRRTSRFRVS